MDLTHPWLALGLLVLVPLLAWLLLRRPVAEDDEQHDGLLVAHLARLRALPRYRALARQQVLWTGVALASTVLVVLGATWLAGRPTATVTEDEEARPGDLVFCLDITPDNRPAAVDLLAQARGLLGSLGDQRVALYGFQSTTAELMPLTDDRGFARNLFHEAQTVLAAASTGSTVANSGDGLVSCAQHFDEPVDERGRAIVLLSPNAAGSGAIHSLLDAAHYAEEHGIRVYTLVPPGAPGAVELRTAAELTGGRSLPLQGRRPLQQVRSLELERLDPPPGPVRRDAPVVPTVLVVAGLFGVVLTGLRGVVR